ncbi:Phage anti-repressor protein [Phaeobacter inhibens]|uniref:antA/AntB antirepressor family protein n=1 Tax=Phaeobacter inhibens TaxID=221822 RepID=UPI000C9C7465|nr:antA/AntB antirepressor family protein [Phaeobacter inhibens]AUQ49951.1 Phage anti-repressor protein [Phaeobacter inhibens]AUR19756.1 Phage anti-repressor protein [Phaeobacter inhibens]
MNLTIVTQNINGENIPTANARDLHAFLEVGKVFGAWIKDRIEQYGFTEGLDYVVFSETGKNSSGGRPAKEYHISLDMAKELSMVERTSKGKEARQYFIEMERRAKEAAAKPQMIDLDDPDQLVPLLANYAQRTKIAEAQVSALTPKAQAYDRLDASEGNLSVRPASKVLGYPEKKLTKWMEVNGWAFRQSGKGSLQAYSQRRKDGFLDHKLRHFQDPRTGEDKVDATLVITPKGLARLEKVLPLEGATA